ncbi:MAG: OmpA family protein [Flavobacteriia bacterium]|nr:OmpA family protein [Flavobacteriia bacterium]
MKIKSILTTLFVGVYTFFNTQVYVPKQVRIANEQYRNENFCEAASLCAKAYLKIERKGQLAKRMKGEMAFKTAECHRQVENVKDANEWYEKAIVLKYYEKVPDLYFLNAEMLRSMGEFAKAKENYKLYKELKPNDKKSDIGIRSCDIANDFKINKTKHVVTNVAALNKEVFEMAPMFGDKKESLLLFSSTRQGGVSSMKDPRSCNNYMDLWVSEMDKKGNWQEPRLLPGDGINTTDNEGTVCFDGRGKRMFFTRCPNLKKQNLGCDIWMSEAKGKEWDIPKKLILKTHDSISVGHPCVNDDGNYLIFSSDLPGGFGGKDLWYTTYNKKDTNWATPINMGPEINTAGNELFPTFSKSGDLYYATDGLPGVGGLDIFKATKVANKEKWENPKNIGYPINSVSNDYALIEKDSKTGYFTSERVGSVGKNYKPDIWKYELPPNLYDLRVNVHSLTDKAVKIEGATVTVSSDNNQKWEGLTNKEGTIYWDKKPNGDRFIQEKQSYTITLSKDNYIAVKPQAFTTVGVDNDQNFIFDLPLLKNAPIRLPEVRYPLAQWSLLSDSTISSKDSLNFVFDLMVEYPNMILELSSHTDARDTDKRNQVLSENRAKACIKYLVEEKGIDARRFVPVGKGEFSPRTVWKKDGKYLVDEPQNMEGVEAIVLTEAFINQFKKKDKRTFEMLHQLNRRTEGKVLSMDFNKDTAPAVATDFFEFKPIPKK